MDVTKLHQLGWKASIGLEEGLQLTYTEFSTMNTPGNPHPKRTN